MAEAEGDCRDGRRRRSPRRCRPPPTKPSGARSKACCPVKPTATTAYVELNAGAGGTEAQDWAEMLMRMYTAVGRAAWLQGAVDGGERGRAGRHQVRHAAGQRPQRLWLAKDRGRRPSPGPHLSPFDANARRQTSFASVWVYPVIDDTIEIDINRVGSEGGHLPRLGCRRTARQQDRQRDPHHASSRPGSSSPARPTAASTATAPTAMEHAEAPGCTRRNC